MDEADLKTLVRAFRASVSEEQAAIHRQMGDLATEVRQRISTAETAILNGLRDSSQRTDFRFTVVEHGLADVTSDLTEVKQDLAGVTGDVAGVKEDVAALKQDVAGVKEDVAALKQDLAGVKEDVAELKQAVGRIEQLLSR